MSDGISFNLSRSDGNRMGKYEKCFISDKFNSIEAHTVDISEIGLGVETNKTVSFKNGCELAVSIPSMNKLFQVKLIWTKKDVENNATRLGLKQV